MKKNKINYFFAYLMIFLVLFNFYSCTKAITYPIQENKKELQISYLDNANNIVEEKTDSIFIKLKDEFENFCMYSKKTAENEYTSYLTEIKNGIVISMIYKDGSNFPSEVKVFKDDQIAVGVITPYRKENQSYDIIWYMDNDIEVFSDINLSKDINTPNNVLNLDSKLKYQIETIKNTLLIWDSIDKYNSLNNKDDSQIMTKMARVWWKKLIGVFLGIIAVVVATFIPVVAPLLIAKTGVVVAAIVGVGMASASAGIVAAANELIKDSDKIAEPKKENKSISIVNASSNNKIEYDKLISFPKNNKFSLKIRALEGDIKSTKITIKVDNPYTNYYSSIRKYFTFYYAGNEYLVDKDYNIIEIGCIQQNNETTFHIEKLQNINDVNDDKKIYLLFEFYDKASKVNDMAVKIYKIRIN